MSIKIIPGSTIEHIASKTQYIVIYIYSSKGNYYQLYNILWHKLGVINNCARDKIKSKSEIQELFKNNEIRVVKYPQLETNKTPIINL